MQEDAEVSSCRAGFDANMAEADESLSYNSIHGNRGKRCISPTR